MPMVAHNATTEHAHTALSLVRAGPTQKACATLRGAEGVLSTHTFILWMPRAPQHPQSWHNCLDLWSTTNDQTDKCFAQLETQGL